MTEKKLEECIRNKKLSLSFWNKYTHFSILIYLLITPIILLFLHIKDLMNNEPVSLKENEIYFIITPILFAILFFKIQNNRLKFKKVSTTLTKDELIKIIENIGAELKWIPYLIGDNIIIVKTNPSFWSGSWGEQITIIFDKNNVLINSICDPDKNSSLVSMGRNKKNENALIKAIKATSR